MKRSLPNAVTVLAALVCFLSARAALAAPIKVFVLAGQSNMVGFAKTPEYPATARPEYPNIRVYYALDEGPLRCAATLKVGSSGLDADAYGPSKFGPEFGIAEQLSQAFPNDELAFIKVAWGGTSLAGDWLSGATDCADPQGKPQCVYPWFVDRTTQALDALAQAPEGYEIWGVFWMQGEADASSAEFSRLGVYRRNLKSFVEEHLRPLFSSYPEHTVAGVLPFVYGKIRNTWPFSGPLLAEQLESQFIIAGVRCTEGPSLASTYTLRPIDPNDPFNFRHYDSAGAMRTGRELGKAFLELLAGKATPGCAPPVDVTALWQSLID